MSLSPTPIAVDDLDLVCGWLDDHCERPAIGMAAHAVYGVVPVCGSCRTAFSIPLINQHTER